MGKYVWNYSNLTIPKIEPHSITKHEVIERYVKIYLEIVGGYYYSDNLIINLVDGFSGGGLYRKNNGELHLGSPMIFIERVKEAEVKLNAEKPHGFTMRPKYYFVEKNPQTKNFLENFLKDELGRSYVNNNVQIFCNPFSNVYKKIINDIKKRGNAHRTIFLLDQYGYSKVPISLINYIFTRLPNAEIILTFNVDSMIDYLSDTNESRAILNKIGIDFDLSQIRHKKALQRQWRTLIQFALYEDFVGKVGSKFVSNLFIKSRNSSRSYWLLHFSMKEKAKNEMEKIHWDFKNHFISQTDSGLRVFSGYDPNKDFGLTGQSELQFTKTEQEESKLKLCRQIPEYLTFEFISAEKFYHQHINDTPATKEMIYEALKRLYRLKKIDVMTSTSSRKRVSAKIKDDDLIKRSKQIYFKYKKG